MNCSLCLLTFNEINGCQQDVPRIQRDQFDNIYAVDGGSTDGTVEYLTSQDIPVYKQPQPGLNNAHIFAVEKCPSDALIVFHPKGTIPVGDTLKFRALFDQGYELIVASRTMKGGKNEEDQKLIKPRKWLVGFLAVVIALIWKREGNTIYDISHGFRGFTKKAFQQMDITPEGLSIDVELVIRSYKRAIKRIEFPTQESPRQHGVTHFKLGPTCLKIGKFFLRELFRP